MKKTKQYKIGIDVGGTKMSAVLFDGENIVDNYTLATPKDTLDGFMIMIKALVDMPSRALFLSMPIPVVVRKRT